MHDRQLLRHAGAPVAPGDVEVLPDEIGRQHYGAGLPQGSGSREPLNRALLAAVRSPRWDDLLARYLGRDE